METDPVTLKPEHIREQLEKLRQELTPQQYVIASARLLDKLKQRDKKPRYAVT